jgi:K+-transporting ATPase ATPase B chain
MTTHAQARPLFDGPIVRRAILDAVRKLDPRKMVRNPVMFVVEVGSAFTTLLYVHAAVTGRGEARPGFILAVSVWLWFTVLFANFAEAMAEGRGKAQADTLRKARKDVPAKRLAAPRKDAGREDVPSSALRKGDLVLVEAGDLIPGDGEIVDGIASVDESAITGESAPVIRESGGDRSAVTGGTKVLSDRIVIRISADPGESFLDRMIALVEGIASVDESAVTGESAPVIRESGGDRSSVTGGTRVLSDRIVVRVAADPGESFLDRMIGLVEGASRQKTPNEIALHILLVGLTIIFLFACVTLVPLALYSGIPLSATAVVALLVCLIPTTIGGLLSAIGIAGMDRLLRKNVIALSGRAVEAAGDVDVLLLDKTGTITLGNRMATEFHPSPGVRVEDLADAAL